VVAALVMVLALTAEAYAQAGGPFVRSGCTSLTSPVAHTTACFDTTAGKWKVWDGANYVYALVTHTGVLNVRDYGAVCDDTTDDATALQNALNAVPTNGAVVLIPGRCATSASLVPKAETVIAGVDPTQSRLRLTSATSGAILLNATSRDRVHVRDVTLRVNGNSQIALEALDSPESTYTNVVFNSAVAGNGIGLRARSTGASGSFQGNVYASRFESLGTGTQLGVAADATGANVWNFYGTKWSSNGTGLLIEKATTVNVFGGRFESNTVRGVDSSTGAGVVCDNVRLSGVYFEGNTTNHYRIQSGCNQWFLDRVTFVGGTSSDTGTLTLSLGDIQGTPGVIDLRSAGTLLAQISQLGRGRFTTFMSEPTLFAALGTPDDGTFLYCSDCTFANPCASGGTGAIAKRLSGAWRCD